jgi:hypothetical protein
VPVHCTKNIFIWLEFIQHAELNAGYLERKLYSAGEIGVNYE